MMFDSVSQGRICGLKDNMSLLMHCSRASAEGVLTRFRHLADLPPMTEVRVEGELLPLGQLTVDELERFRMLAEETLRDAHTELRPHNFYLYPLVALILAADATAQLPQMHIIASTTLSQAARELARQFAVARLAPQEMAGRA